MIQFEQAIETCPLIGILRGIEPKAAKQLGHILYEAGLRVLEVPINSPDPFRSITILRETLPRDCVVGAGTLMSTQDLEDLHAAGGQVAVMPHTNPLLIQRSIELGLLPIPGVFTPSEMFAAIQAGAMHLKIFPANVIGQDLVRAARAVLPKEVKLYAVGGINPDSLRTWQLIDGFGVGSSLFRPSDTPELIQKKATSLVAAARTWLRRG